MIFRDIEKESKRHLYFDEIFTFRILLFSGNTNEDRSESSINDSGAEIRTSINV